MFQVCYGCKLLQQPSLPGIARMNAGHVSGGFLSLAQLSKNSIDLLCLFQHRIRHPCGKKQFPILVVSSFIIFFFSIGSSKKPKQRDFMFILSYHGTRLCIIDAQLPDALKAFWRGLGFWGWLVIEWYRTTTPVQEERFNGNQPPGLTWQRLMMRDEEQLSGTASPQKNSKYTSHLELAPRCRLR